MGYPGEIDEIFDAIIVNDTNYDAISYCKGALVTRMLHDYVGENVCFNKKISGSLCLFLTVFKSLQVIPTKNLFPVDF